MYHPKWQLDLKELLLTHQKRFKRKLWLLFFSFKVFPLFPSTQKCQNNLLSLFSSLCLCLTLVLSLCLSVYFVLPPPPFIALSVTSWKENQLLPSVWPFQENVKTQKSKKISMLVWTISNASLKHLQRESQPSPMWVSPDFGLSLYQVSINFRLTLKKLSKQSRSVSFRTLVDKIEKHHHVMTHFDLCKNFHMCLTSHCIPFWSKLSNCQTAKTENFVCYQGPDVSKHVTFSLCRVSWQKRKVSASWGPFWSMSRFMIQLKGSFILSIT